MHLSTVNVPIDFGIDWPWSSVSFIIPNLFFLPNFAFLIHFESFCIYLVRPSPVNASHSTWHGIYTDSYMHVDRVALWTVKESNNESSWDHRSPASPQLGDWQWILQAAVGFRQIISTSHTDISYFNIGNHRNNCKRAFISLYLFSSHTLRSALFLVRLSTHMSPSLFHILTSFVRTSPITMSFSFVALTSLLRTLSLLVTFLLSAWLVNRSISCTFVNSSLNSLVALKWCTMLDVV